MNYDHAYHAGNYADVFKHVLLLRLWRALQRKEKGILYLDTHAGRGTYDLTAKPAGRPERAQEWPAGIGRLWEARDLPASLVEYLDLVREYNRRHGSGRLRHYPGSPALAALVRRPQDRLVFWERQDAPARSLRRKFDRVHRLSVTHGDGYGALRAHLPPPERRALVFIDPPFEAPDEFDAVRRALSEGLERLPTGVYAVWYPVTHRAKVAAFQAALARPQAQPAFWAELDVTGAPDIRMKGCGLLVINPPWHFAEDATGVLPKLAAWLGVDAGAAFRSGWLVPDR